MVFNGQVASCPTDFWNASFDRVISWWNYIILRITSLPFSYVIITLQSECRQSVIFIVISCTREENHDYNPITRWYPITAKKTLSFYWLCFRNESSFVFLLYVNQIIIPYHILWKLACHCKVSHRIEIKALLLSNVNLKKYECFGQQLGT